jgi:hypothetical protein
MKGAVPFWKKRMACWVVPAIAAELWGVTVHHVLSGIRDGSIASRHEHGFVFVDALPGGYTYHRPRRPDEPVPATFVVVQPAESVSTPDQPAAPPAIELCPEDAEVAEIVAAAEGSIPWGWVGAAAVEEDGLPPLDEEEDDTPLPPRDAVRATVARQRRRPIAA